MESPTIDNVYQSIHYPCENC